MAATHSTTRPDDATNDDDDVINLSFPGQQNLTQPSQQTTSQAEPPRARTRGATIRLSATLRAMGRAAIVRALKDTTVNTRVKITMASSPQWNEETHTGVIIAIPISSCRTVQFDNAGCHTIPFEDDRVITKLDDLNQPLLVVPVTRSNRPIDLSSPHRVLYVDGGARPNPGAGAAAVVEFKNDAKTTHSKFYPWTSNNICEAIAMLAALRLAARDTSLHTFIVCDAELIYNGILGLSQVKDPKLRPIVDEAKIVFHSIIGFVTIAHMKRSNGNPADTPCTTAITRAAGVGDASLFFEPTLLPARPSIAPPPPPTAQLHNLISDTAAIPTSLQQFAALRRFRTRTTVPDTSQQLWAQLLSAPAEFCHNAPFFLFFFFSGRDSPRWRWSGRQVLWSGPAGKCSKSQPSTATLACKKPRSPF